MVDETKAAGTIETRLYVIHFERIGRTYRDQEVTFSARDADDLAEQIFRFARSKLASSGYSVLVDLEEGRGSIEFGRFGEFTISDRGVFQE